MEPNKEESCKDCSGNCCSMGHMHGMGGKYHILRWMLGLAIIMIVFWMGFKLGEFKGYFGDFGHDNGYYSRGMMNYGNGDNSYFQSRRTRNQDNVYPPMMFWQQQQLPSTSTPGK